MYADTGQNGGTLRVTIREAASRLGVTEGAIRKRIQRGSLPKEHGGDGRVYVYLDSYEDMSHPESQVDRDPLVEELHDRVRFLERELERRGDEGERYQRIIAGLAQANVNLTDRMKELEAPPAEPIPAQQPPPASGRSGEDASKPPPAPPGPQEGSESRTARPWWRRVFGR